MDDTYDDVRYHPSHSIPNAAYPDSPYRPGAGPSGPSCPASAVMMCAPEWTHDDIPDPPPPYDPTQAPAVYLPLNAAAFHAAAVAAAAAANMEAGRMRQRPEMVPLQLMPMSFMRPMGGGGGGAAAAAAGGGPVPPLSSAATVQDGDADKSDSVPAPRRRKQRHFRICLVAMTVVAFLVGALVIGFAVGLMKASSSHSSSSSSSSNSNNSNNNANNHTNDYYYHD